LAQTHPNISEVEKKKVCSLMDCQKLSREVYAHAAQNDRFQEILRDSDSPAATAKETLSPPELSSYKNELSKLNRENQYLKLELLKVKMKLKELEKERAFEVMSGSDCSSSVSTASVAKPRLPRKSFINSVSQKLGKLINPFGLKQGQTKQPKSRRHSIS